MGTVKTPSETAKLYVCLGTLKHSLSNVSSLAFVVSDSDDTPDNISGIFCIVNQELERQIELLNECLNMIDTLRGENNDEN